MCCYTRALITNPRGFSLRKRSRRGPPLPKREIFSSFLWSPKPDWCWNQTKLLRGCSPLRVVVFFRAFFNPRGSPPCFYIKGPFLLMIKIPPCLKVAKKRCCFSPPGGSQKLSQIKISPAPLEGGIPRKEFSKGGAPKMPPNRRFKSEENF